MDAFDGNRSLAKVQCRLRTNFASPKGHYEMNDLMSKIDPTTFLVKVFAALDRDGIDVTTFELDHLCYRVEDMGRYVAMRKLFSKHGKLLGEHLISGRPISTFRSNSPFVFHGRSIDVIELPAPKHGSPYREGYEHAEFVVSEDVLSFCARYPVLDWDRSGSSKSTNADVRLQYDGFSVKFHRRSLALVIAEEQGKH